MPNRKINYNILVGGSIVYDRIMNFPGKFSDHILPDKIHILNVSFTLDKLNESFGGTGANIAYNLALLGERPKLFGTVGEDFSKYASWLKKNKVDISRVKMVKDILTSSCYIMTDQDDNQITGFYGGSGAIPILPKLSGLKRALAIISPDLVARMLEYVKIFKRNNVPYIFDPGQQITSLKTKELKWAIFGAKALIGNDYEIQLILNKLKIKFNQLKKLVEILVLTKGSQGSEIYNQGKKIKVRPAKPKNTSDPTGAGDAYRAGFIKGLVMGWPLDKCAKLASVVAVYTVEKYGTQTHKFSWPELARRYKENYKENL
jgi:adenosine kinase